MAIKKSEIYSQIWAACDKLRGGVDVNANIKVSHLAGFRS